MIRYWCGLIASAARQYPLTSAAWALVAIAVYFYATKKKGVKHWIRRTALAILLGIVWGVMVAASGFLFRFFGYA